MQKCLPAESTSQFERAAERRTECSGGRVDFVAIDYFRHQEVGENNLARNMTKGDNAD